MTDSVLSEYAVEVAVQPRGPWLPAGSATAWGIIGAMAMVATAIVWPSPLEYDGTTLDPVWLFFVALAAIGAILRRRGLFGLGSGFELVAVFMLVSLVAAFASAALAWTAFPLVDGALQSADALLGFSWPAMIATLRDDTRLLTALSYIYVSLGPQPLLLIILLCATRRQAFAWRFVTAWAITLTLTLMIFPFTPALGNFAANHIAWGAIPGVRVPSGWAFPQALTGFRDGSVTMLGDNALGGIIAFPSFHTAGAVMLAWGFLPFRVMRFPMIALNLAMIASALVIGGHYLVDIIAGVAVAIAGIAIAGQTVRTDGRSPG